jgi:uridine phosphorylase
VQHAPILEFDPAREAMLDPQKVVARIDIAERCVVCFFQDVLEALVREGRLKQRVCQRSEIGDHPVYEMEHAGQRLAVFHPGVGAPLAAALLEEVIALGCNTFVACGGAGGLNRELALGHIVVPHSAVRDEGTSYHYLPPSREVAASPEAVAAIEATLRERDYPYVVAKTWTTDAIYRETPAKIQARRAEGCVTVEMETATFFAVAQFRGVRFGQLLYAGDDLSGDVWDGREWTRQASTREQLFWLAAEACLRI